jgi:hypothetical protein
VIAEAVQRPTMKFVATKRADQLDLQALHRARERLVRQRTGIINQIRAFLLEREIAVRQGLRFLRTELPGILAKRSDVLSPRMMGLIEDLAGDWRRLDERIESLSTDITRLVEQDPACERLMTVPGIGPIISSATAGRSAPAMCSLRKLLAEVMLDTAMLKDIASLLRRKVAVDQYCTDSPSACARGSILPSCPLAGSAQQRFLTRKRCVTKAGRNAFRHAGRRPRIRSRSPVCLHAGPASFTFVKAERKGSRTRQPDATAQYVRR